MTVTPESLVTNAAAIGAVVAALSSSVPVVTLVLAIVYVGAALPGFFFDSDTYSLDSLTSTIVVAALVGGIAGRLVAEFVGVNRGVIVDGAVSTPAPNDDTLVGTLFTRSLYMLIAVLGTLGVVAGALILVSPVVTSAWTSAATLAIVVGVLAALSGGAATIAVAGDVTSVYYALVAAFVAAPPAAVYDYLQTHTRLGAAGVSILVTLATTAAAAAIGWIFVEPRLARHLTTSATRYALFWLFTFIVVASIYLIGAAVADATDESASDASNVAWALFVAAWALAAGVTFCFGVVTCFRAARRRRSGDEKRAGDSLVETTTTTTSTYAVANRFGGTGGPRDIRRQLNEGRSYVR